MKVVLTGANGQLGMCLLERFPSDWKVSAFDSGKLNITNAKNVMDQISNIQPNLIINAAAYTAVDKAEDEPELARSVNVEGTKNLAKVAKHLGVRLIHVSTDYVFDGNAKQPYSETDTTNPQSVYGQTKLEGELAAQEILEDLIIFRTAWVFSEHGNNFYKTMLRLFAERKVLSIVADQIGTPTYAGDLADAIIHAIAKKIPAGIYHYSGDKIVSWFEYAQFIYEHHQTSESKKLVFEPIESNAYPQKAKRPSYSVLSNRKIEGLGIASSNWRAAIRHLLQN